MEVEIEYCVPCGHLGRAIDLQRALLEEFGRRLEAVRLKTGEGGVFKVRVDGELVLDAQQQGFDPAVVREAINAHTTVSWPCAR